MPVLYNFLSNSFGLLSRLFLNVCVFPSRPRKQIAEQWALLRCDSTILSSFFLIFLIFQLLSRYKRPNSSWSVYEIIANLTKRFERALSKRKMYFYHFLLLPWAIIQTGIKHSHSEMSQLFTTITWYRRIGVAGCFHILGPQWETVIPPLWQEHMSKDP